MPRRLNVAMIVPPMSNLNTPYSASPRLAGWLRRIGHDVRQVDVNLELFLRLYSRRGLERLFAAIDPTTVGGDLADVWDNRDRYVCVIEEVVALLQGRDLAAAHRFVRRGTLPEGPWFRGEAAGLRERRFGSSGTVDLARHLATLVIMDLVSLFRSTLTPHFGLLDYADKLASPQPSFDALAAELARPANVVEEMIAEVASDLLPPDVDLVCFTCPFPGMLFGSLFLGKWLAQARPGTRRALGGGFPSTEMRRLEDPRIFDYVDYVSLDDGELPLQQICDHITGDALDSALSRTFVRREGKVVFHDSQACASPRFRELPAPDYEGVRLDRYVDLLPAGNNPITRFQQEGRWLKLTAAHGCYWKKCTFCDIHLSYIRDFDPLSPRDLADQMDALHEQTGVASFHFTDEAAPPPLLVNLAIELLRRGRTYQFWGNIRYDPGFTADRCKLLAAAGMVAVTGGIEIASDELLPKIAKGITIPQVVKVLQAFSSAGIVTHAYLIYGFPGETPQDTIDSLEIMRQMMKARVLHSAFYHQFTLTRHSPVGKQPELYGIRTSGPSFAGFTDYVLEYQVLQGTAPTSRIRKALQHAIESFIERTGLEADVRSWLPRGEFPAPRVPPGHVEALLASAAVPTNVTPRLAWLGGAPRWSRGLMSVTCADGETFSIPVPQDVAESLARCHPARWGATPPRPDDFEPREWLALLHDRGLVQV